MVEPEVLLGFLIQKFGRRELTEKGQPVIACTLSLTELRTFYPEFNVYASVDSTDSGIVLIVREETSQSPEGKQPCKNTFH